MPTATKSSEEFGVDESTVVIVSDRGAKPTKKWIEGDLYCKGGDLHQNCVGVPRKFWYNSSPLWYNSPPIRKIPMKNELFPGDRIAAGGLPERAAAARSVTVDRRRSVAH